MTCGSCGKNEASVFYKKLEGGMLSEHHLCAHCAKKARSEAASSPFFNFLSMLGKGPRPPLPKPLECGRCGLPYEEFRKSGRLGCAGCYESFAAPLDGVLDRYHGAKEHAGKAPLRSPEAIKALRAELEDAVAREDFESAARLRDRLVRLERM